jgi:S1-C subfamily serine protease
VLQNLFAGILILWQRPFIVGDEIKVREFEGTVEDITTRSTALKRMMGIDAQTQGLVVLQVDPSGPAADAGIQSGDVIEQANQQTLHSVADLRAAIERSRDKPVLLLVNHRGTSLFITVRVRQE